MDTCTTVSTCGTTLLSGVGQSRQDQVVRPRTELRAAFPAASKPGLAAWRPRTAVGATVRTFQGGAMTTFGPAAVIDRMVTDHQYSTRPGLSSCSPPV